MYVVACVGHVCMCRLGRVCMCTLMRVGHLRICTMVCVWGVYVYVDACV